MEPKVLCKVALATGAHEAMNLRIIWRGGGGGTIPTPLVSMPRLPHSSPPPILEIPLLHSPSAPCRPLRRKGSRELGVRPWTRCCSTYCPHFTEEETEAPGSAMKSKWREPGLQVKSDSKVHAFY